MELKKGFKQTAVGIIPEDWEEVTVKSITTFHKQGYYTTEQYKQDGEYFLLRGTDMQNPLIDLSTTPKINANQRDYESYKVLSGDFLFVRSGAIGRYGIVTDQTPESIFGSYLINFRFSPEIDSIYLGYFYQSSFALNQIKSITQGGGNLNINAENIKALKLPLPPTKAEQTAIATALSDMDNLIAALEKLIAKKKAIKQGAMQELLRPKEGWVEFEIHQLGKIVTGSTPSTIRKDYWNGEIPWITPTDIGSQKDIFVSERQITQNGLGAIRRLPANTLLVTCIASIGKNAILKKDGASNQQINAIIPFEQFDVDFLYYLFEFNTKYLLANAGITATLIISKRDFAALSLFIPIKEKQIEISKRLSDTDAEISAIEEKLAKYKMLKQGMMQELLTGKTRLV